MNIRTKISDYNENKQDIEKWLYVKGEDKYAVFLGILEHEDLETSWENVSSLYRYDKRLLVKNFKYLSFFEEYCRSQILRKSNLKYDKVQEFTFGVLKDRMLECDGLHEIFHVKDLKKDLENVVKLRNHVCHNRILLNMTGCEYAVAVQSLYRVLPEDYRAGYAKDLKSCNHGIPISEFFERLPY